MRDFFLFWVGGGYIRTVILSKIIARQLLIFAVNTSFHANIWRGDGAESLRITF